MKEVKALDNDSKDEWEELNHEVETLERRRHPNIIPLLGSYYLHIPESSGRLAKTMHLIFPWAGLDLEMWLISRETPGALQGISREERRAHIYHSIYALVSGLWSLHRESEGKITSHHDLRPSNILVIERDLKIADLGRSHLRPATEGSQTEGRPLGTYGYQPPEYWQDDGSRANVSHGRAFDIWAMGCILIELAILIVHVWEPQMVTKFRTERQSNKIKDRPRVMERHSKREDGSFHNNWLVVERWVNQLKHHHGTSKKLKRILDVAMGMLDHEPGSRLYTWEAELDLHDIEYPDEEQDLLKKGRYVCSHRRGVTVILKSPMVYRRQCIEPL